MGITKSEVKKVSKEIMAKVKAFNNDMKKYDAGIVIMVVKDYESGDISLSTSFTGGFNTPMVMQLAEAFFKTFRKQMHDGMLKLLMCETLAGKK